MSSAAEMSATDSPSLPATSLSASLRPDFNKLDGQPAWFQQRVKDAWEEFLAAPVPGNRDEAWRYSNAKRVDLANLRPAAEPTDAEKESAIAKSKGLDKASANFIFLNDRLIHRATAGLPAGIECLPIAEALQSHGDVLEQYLMKKKSELGSPKFAALHLSWLAAGTVVLVPKNAVLADPIEIFHWVSGENAVVFPHTLVVAGENSEVTVIDHHGSLNEELAQSIAVADIVAGNGSKIRFFNIQEMAPQAKALHISTTTVGRDAEVQALQLHLGASFTRSESVSTMAGENARSEMFGVSLPGSDQIVDMRTLQYHAAPHTFSDLLYKNSLFGQARTVFAGLIMVAEGAHFTDAYQKCRNLLNSSECEATSMPGLEINADQVKCSHGATSAPIATDELFYLKARGIPDEEARRVIALGFLEEVFSRIAGEDLAAMLDERLERHFARVG